MTHDRAYYSQDYNVGIPNRENSLEIMAISMPLVILGLRLRPHSGLLLVWHRWDWLYCNQSKC